MSTPSPRARPATSSSRAPSPGSIDFGGGIALASTGGKNAFVAKLDSTGVGQWARSFGDGPDGGSYDKLAYGVAVDGAGEAFVCGEFAGSLVAGSTTLVSAGGFDAFVVKLNPMGTVLWAQALSGPGDQAALGIAVDSPGNSVVEGLFEDTLTVSSTTLVSRGGFDGFTARFDSNGSGSLSWVIPFGGVADQIGTGVVLTDAGTTVATGYFAGEANVGVDLEAGVITSAGGFDVASYELVTNSGATLGSTGYGDPSNQYGYAIAADAIRRGARRARGSIPGQHHLRRDARVAERRSRRHLRRQARLERRRAVEHQLRRSRGTDCLRHRPRPRGQRRRGGLPPGERDARHDDRHERRGQRRRAGEARSRRQGPVDSSGSATRAIRSRPP